MGQFIHISLILFFSCQIAKADHLSINGERLNAHIIELSKIGKNIHGGVSRVAYTEADRKARQYVRQLMEDAGLLTSIDAAGNLVGTRPSSNPSLKLIVMGSHIDTVPDGGNYDGNVGSLSSIEVVKTLFESKSIVHHPLQVIIFENEEGGHIGSRAITAGLSKKDLELQSLS